MCLRVYLLQKFTLLLLINSQIRTVRFTEVTLPQRCWLLLFSAAAPTTRFALLHMNKRSTCLFLSSHLSTVRLAPKHAHEQSGYQGQEEVGGESYSHLSLYSVTRGFFCLSCLVYQLSLSHQAH